MIFDKFVGSYVLVRSDGSGVHFGLLDEVENDKVVLSDTRRIWYWAGAASLSELAMKGPGKPADCKFPAATPLLGVYGVLEILPCTAEAINKIKAVPEWTANE